METLPPRCPHLRRERKTRVRSLYLGYALRPLADMIFGERQEFPHTIAQYPAGWSVTSSLISAARDHRQQL